MSVGKFGRCGCGLKGGNLNLSAIIFNDSDIPKLAPPFEKGWDLPLETIQFGLGPGGAHCEELTETVFVDESFDTTTDAPIHFRSGKWTITIGTQLSLDAITQRPDEHNWGPKETWPTFQVSWRSYPDGSSWTDIFNGTQASPDYFIFDYYFSSPFYVRLCIGNRRLFTNFPDTQQFYTIIVYTLRGTWLMA